MPLVFLRAFNGLFHRIDTNNFKCHLSILKCLPDRYMKSPDFIILVLIGSLKDKYWAVIYDEKITKESNDSISLSIKKENKPSKDIIFYFYNQEPYAEYQA